MVTNKHFRRLKHIYTATPTAPAGDRVAISYGRAEMDGEIDPAHVAGVVNRMPHQQLLSDSASLAAGSLEKEHSVTAEHFSVNVVDPSYSGPVVAEAQVVMAEPPRYVVRAVLVTDAGDVVAQAMGVFHPTGDELPPDPEPGEEAPAPESLQPASFMPVHTTPFGMLCLN
jgi:hypothetical protein